MQKTLLSLLVLFLASIDSCYTVAYAQAERLSTTVVCCTYEIVTAKFENYSFCNGSLVEITAEQMNSVYSKEGVSKEEFANNFVFLSYHDGDVNVGGKIYRTSEGVEYAGNIGQITTFGLSWWLDAEYLWQNHGQTPKATAIYKHKNKEYYIVLDLIAGEPLAAHEIVEFPDGDKFVEMWSDELTLGMFNVRVPNIGENKENQCTFVNDILTLYLDQKDPVTVVKNEINTSSYKVSNVTGVTDVCVEYVIKGARCEGYGSFAVKADGKELWYNNALIATLDGTVVTLNDDHDTNEMAEELLNTNKLIVTFAVRAEFESCHGVLPVPSAGELTFDVRYVRPLNVNPEAVGYFQDGSDFGGEGTLIKASNVVSLQDWRGKSVVRGNSYYGYYGISRVTVDNSSVTCNLESGNNLPLPRHIKAGIVDEASLNDADLGSVLSADMIDAYFYYKNNGTVLQKDIEINFPVIVEYWWGRVVTDYVTVTVKKTSGVASGIHNVDSAVSSDVIYDLYGRRLSAPQKGINIINGKKVLIK